MTLLLASGSETRRRMLAAAGIPLEIGSPDVDEDHAKARLLADGAGASDIAFALAELKALAVQPGPGTLVLGADQVLEQEDGTILSKARSRSEAAGQLAALAGRTHRLHSAAVLAQGGRIVWRGLETASLAMRPFSPSFLDAYLDAEYDAVRFNVGVYRIEGMGAQLFERVEGSHFAILGLPLISLLSELRARGVLAS